MSLRPRKVSPRAKALISYLLIAIVALTAPTETLLKRVFVTSVLADTSPQVPPFTQNWSNAGLITTDDTWSGVPGIIGYRGDDAVAGTGVDPQTVTQDLSAVPDVNANRSDPNAFATGGVTEFDGIANPVVALQGSGTADFPNLVISLNTTGQTGINVAYNLRDIDGSADNAVQPVALQYRVGASGAYTNLPAGFVADATTGPNLATLVTPVSVTLPAACDNQAIVQVRIISNNAVGSDEWVGIDDINVTAGGGGGPTTLNINDVAQAETNSGQTTFNFNVSITAPAGVGGVTFNATTADGTANAGSDYDGFTNQPFTILQGNTSVTVPVMVNGDVTAEPNETFFVNITSVVGATAGDVQGLGTINNDDVSVVAIHAIQGSGSTSPLVSQSVTTTGIVTGLKSNGFFIQDPAPDSDPNTSEGVFVFTSSAPPPAAAIGNSVQVSATVQEFIPAADPASPPTTELITPTVSVLSTGNSLPAAIDLSQNNETTIASETSNPLDSLEEFEGMRVTVPSLTVTGATQGTITEPGATVASSGVFIGVVTGVPRPFRTQGIAISDPLPAGAPGTIPRFDENPERIRVDSDAQPGTTPIDVAAGTVVTNVTGPLDYAFRCYTIDPDAATPPTVGVQPGSTPVPAATADEVTVASFNMERFFDDVDDVSNPNDPILTTAAYQRRLNKASLIVRTVQRYPDVIGVEEMENLTTLQAVAARINSDAQTIDLLPNPNYTAYLVEGNDVGGIDVGFLVKQSRISVVNVTQFGKTDTITNPDSSTSILNDRPPLVLRATCPRPLGGVLPFTVIVNHLRSLNGIDDTTGGSNGYATGGARVRDKRRLQAEYLADLIQARQVADPTELIITVGDMNAFAVNDGYVDVIGTIKGTPAPASQVTLASTDRVNPDLYDMVDFLPAAQQYSYNFDGNAQTLDHIILNRKAFVFLTRFAYARNDSDFAVKNYESTNELRISDHDQPVAYFNLTLDPSAATGVLSGRITDTNGDAVAGSVVRLSGSQTRKTITDAGGNYRFDNVETGGFYTVTPARANYAFSPANRSFSLTANKTDATFTGVAGGDNLNPIDTTEFFVRQGYLDLLGREPDEAGFNYWSDQINQCGSDQLCVAERRREVAAAFFIAPEYQLGGSFIQGLYKGTLGRSPAASEYALDRQQVVGGANLETEKQAFADNFVQRTEFTGKYSASLSAESFVDALLQNVQQTSAVDLSNQRASLIDRYNAGATLNQSRSLVVRDLTENSAFRNAEYNSTFVMSEYFAYLRRDPEQAGYRFWLNVLEHGDPGNYRGMVCAFVNSAEYQLRFSRIVSRSDAECSALPVR